MNYVKLMITLLKVPAYSRRRIKSERSAPLTAETTGPKKDISLINQSTTTPKKSKEINLINYNY